MQNIYDACYQCLMEDDLVRKQACAKEVYSEWLAGKFHRESSNAVESILEAGHPVKPELVPLNQLKRRKLNTEKGRASLIHAIAHIEFNAINLALDAVYRFRDMPDEYYQDWLKVAAEEAYHFSLLSERLEGMGYQYGDMPAHKGLWESCVTTDHDVMVRMALVPRVLEARGLDVTPGMIRKLEGVGDHETVDILHIILRDEIGHVKIGSRWFHYCCNLRGLEPKATFIELIQCYMQGSLRGPFNDEARLQAGFSKQELDMLVKLLG